MINDKCSHGKLDFEESWICVRVSGSLFYSEVEGSLAVKQAGRGNCESYLEHGWFLLGWCDVER